MRFFDWNVDSSHAVGLATGMKHAWAIQRDNALRNYIRFHAGTGRLQIRSRVQSLFEIPLTHAHTHAHISVGFFVAKAVINDQKKKQKSAERVIKNKIQS